jgi:hypothetical protein
VTILAGDLFAVLLATGAVQLQPSPCSFHHVGCWLLSTMPAAELHAWRPQQKIPGRILDDGPCCKRRVVPGIHLHCYSMPRGRDFDPNYGNNLDGLGSHKTPAARLSSALQHLEIHSDT